MLFQWNDCVSDDTVIPVRAWRRHRVAMMVSMSGAQEIRRCN